MADNLPSGPKIDREALERIIRRAAELQAGEKDIGEGLTDQELYQLGQDVGIGDRYLRQALLEERTRASVEPQRGLLVWLAGPNRVAASRTIPRPRREAEPALQSWMTDGELLQVKRRYPEQTTWEAQQGAYASLKRAFGSRGRRYTLARAREVAGAITEVDDRHCHVQLVADVGNALKEQLTGATVLGAAGSRPPGGIRPAIENPRITGGLLVIFLIVPSSTMSASMCVRPSSSTSMLIAVPAAICAMRLPVAVSPVIETIRTFGWPTRRSPILLPEPVITLPGIRRALLEFLAPISRHDCTYCRPWINQHAFPLTEKRAPGR